MRIRAVNAGMGGFELFKRIMVAVVCIPLIFIVFYFLRTFNGDPDSLVSGCFLKIIVGDEGNIQESRITQFRFVEVAPHIYAAISPAQDMDITDAGLMDNFSNAGIILRGEGRVCDTWCTVAIVPGHGEVYDPVRAQSQKYVF